MGAESSTLAGAEALLVDGEHHRGRGKVAQRREHRIEFEAAIAAFNAERRAGEPAAAAAAVDSGQRIRVAVRKRPLFPHETAKGDFDAVCCSSGGVWMHRTMMRADLKHMVLESFDFAFPGGVFSETQDTDAVFAAAVAPLVSAATQQGGVSTVMCFGQTGSGKTYTTNGVSERVADSLFANLPAGASISALCVEVAGAKVRDLLGGRAAVSLLEDSDGVVCLKGAVAVPAADAAALKSALAQAHAARAAAATGVHDASSRSHSVCRLAIHDQSGGELGRVDLVDLAGSEWAADREQHSADRQREGAEINSSLMCLKACMRIAMVEGEEAEPARLPYRQHGLTKLLKASFTATGDKGGDADSGRSASTGRTLLLATLSPSSADTEHSLSTLQHVAAIANAGCAAPSAGQNDSSSADGGGSSGGILQTEATKVSRQVVTTNVPQAREMLRQSGREDTEDEGGNGHTEGWEELNPIDWSANDVAVWWTAAASRAVVQINQEVAEGPGADAEPEPSPVPSAEETVQLVLEDAGGGPLGMAFVKAATDCSALPVVSGVKEGSASYDALHAEGARGMPADLKGWRLLGAITSPVADLASAAGLHAAAALRTPRTHTSTPHARAPCMRCAPPLTLSSTATVTTEQSLCCLCTAMPTQQQ